LSVVVPFPKSAREPFRLDGQADRLAGVRTQRLLTATEALGAIRDLRKSADSEELREHEWYLRQSLAREEDFMRTLFFAFRVTEYVAPIILRHTDVGDRATIHVEKRLRQNLPARKLGIFDCTSRGGVLVAHKMIIMPERRVVAA
jgi:hypothetical protein